MVTEVLQLIINGIMAGTILAVPAIGLTAIFAVLKDSELELLGDLLDRLRVASLNRLGLDAATLFSWQRLAFAPAALSGDGVSAD